MAEETEKREYKGAGSVLGGFGVQEEVHLRDYLQVIQKHRWTVITAFVVLVTTVTIGSFSTTPIYSASTTIQIDKEPPKVLKFEDVVQIDGGAYDYYPTQQKIIQSRVIARKVVEQLALWNHSQFQEKSMVGEATAAVVPHVETEAMEELIDSFLELLSVVMVKKSRLAEITYDSAYPELSAEVANQVAQAYIDYNLESKYKATEKARDWLSRQLKEFQAKVEVSEEALHSFARKNGIFSLEKDENLVIKRLEELNGALSTAESDRISKESFYKEVTQYSPDTMLIAQNAGLEYVNGLKKELSGLESEYVKLRDLYKHDYPRVVRLKAQMESLEKKLEVEFENFVKGTELAYKISLERERLLRAAFEEQKELALKMKEKSVQYNILKREVDTNKELYDGLLQRVKETGVSAGLETSNIQVVDMAVVPQFPSKPNKLRNILLSMVMGLFMGVGLAFFREYFDYTIKDPDEISKLFNLPTLGLVPSLQSTLQKYGKKGNGHGAQPSVEDLYLVSQKYPRSSVSEACRTFRTSLLFSTPGHPPKTILVTSNNPREGKTFVSCNLGIVLAQGGARTLIIDADLRRPFCHKAFSVSNSPGITDLLTGHATLQEVIVSTEIGGLDVLPAGPTSPNPPELLDSRQFMDIIEELEKEYDFIVFDSAPVMHFADSLILANKVDGTVIVTRSEKTTKDDLRNSIGLMEGVQANVLGVVMNVIDISKSDYYYNYYYYYGDGAEKGAESRVS